MKEIFFSLTKNFCFSSRKTIFFKFLRINCLGIFISEANTIKWRYASAKASADCRGEFRTLYLQGFFHFFEFFIFSDCYGDKRAKQPKVKNNNYICHTTYVRNSIAYDHDFWCNCVKWWYLQALFSFFEIFIFLGCYGGKTHTSGTIYHMLVICGTLV